MDSFSGARSQKRVSPRASEAPSEFISSEDRRLQLVREILVTANTVADKMSGLVSKLERTADRYEILLEQATIRITERDISQILKEAEKRKQVERSKAPGGFDVEY